MPFAAEEARECFNFQVSMAIYLLIAGALAFVLIGFFLIPVLIIANLVLTVIAAIKANEGSPIGILSQSAFSSKRRSRSSDRADGADELPSHCRLDRSADTRCPLWSYPISVPITRAASWTSLSPRPDRFPTMIWSALISLARRIV